MNACLPKRRELEVQKMTEDEYGDQVDMQENIEEESTRSDSDEHTVFVGAKPFMNPR